MIRTIVCITALLTSLVSSASPYQDIKRDPPPPDSRSTAAESWKSAYLQSEKREIPYANSCASGQLPYRLYESNGRMYVACRVPRLSEISCNCDCPGTPPCEYPDTSNWCSVTHPITWEDTGTGQGCREDSGAYFSGNTTRIPYGYTWSTRGRAEGDGKRYYGTYEVLCGEDRKLEVQTASCQWVPADEEPTQ